jgi:hypothetical protein
MMDQEMLESVAADLQRRIGEITSRYETDVAVMKHQFIQEINKRDEEIARLREQLEDRNAKNKEAD